MRRNFMHATLISWFLVLTGCAALEGSPDRSSDPTEDLKELAQFFDPSLLREYAEISDSEPDRKRMKRNEIITGRLAAIDLRFNLFQQGLYQEGIGLNIGTDVATISLGAAGALVSGGASQVLSGISGGIVGVKQSVDKNAFFERTMPALLSEMRAQRKTVLISIIEGLERDVASYPLSRALIDVEEYYNAGTIPGAIAGIIQSSGEKAARAEVILFPERTRSFFEPARQVQVSDIITRIDALTGGQAIALERNAPVRTDAVESAVAARDPSGERFTDQTGDVAKAILKFRVAMMEPTDQALQQWERAIEEVVGNR